MYGRCNINSGHVDKVTVIIIRVTVAIYNQLSIITLGVVLQGVVTFIRSVEPSATGIKDFDGQKFSLIALKKGP